MEAGEQPAEVGAIDPAGLRDGVERRDLDKIPFDELLGPRERAEGGGVGAAGILLLLPATRR